MLTLWSPAFASEDGAPPPVIIPPTSEPASTQIPPSESVEVTEMPTELPQPTVVSPTEELPAPTDEPVEIILPRPTAEDEPPVHSIVVPTRERGNIQPPTRRGIDQPEYYQTFCQMSIDDAGDHNPFTYVFNVVNAQNIASYAWNFGDSGTATTATAPHTYATTGVFPITLVCTPTPGFGAPLNLTGSVSISSSPVADFTLSPDDTFTALPPFTISTVDASEPGGLTYAWKISADVDSLAPGFYTAATKNITYTFTSADFIANGFGEAGPAIFYFHLIVTDGAGVQNSLTRSVVFNAPAPEATFKPSPASGPAPLLASVEGIDLETGPITSWEWDFDDDGTIDATGQGPHTYNYAIAGVYPIVLNYAGPGGGGTVTKAVVAAPSGDTVKALFTYELKGSVPGGILVCFTNTSTGPVAVSQWDFDGDGTYDLTSNDAEVCYTYPVEGFVMVGLLVENATASSTSTGSQAVNVVAEPIASFTVTPGTTITWGTLINLTDTSTGAITTWEWDFNGDGVTDTTTRNPANVSLAQLGANPIRLTVTGPGGMSFVEAIVFVDRLELTCAFSGSLNVLPGDGPQTYTSNVTNRGGRTVTYKWTVEGTGAGLPIVETTQNMTVNWASLGFGAFQVTLQASTDDGSMCTESKTVNRAWNALNCQISSVLPSPLYPNGNPYTFTANVGGLNGRSILSYQWYLDGALLPSETGSTYTWTNTTNSAGIASVNVRYEVVVDNGAYVAATSDCHEQITFTVSAWPLLVCNAVNGTIEPYPMTPDNITRSYSYSANVSGIAGRTATYTWSVIGGIITSTNPRVNNNNVTVRWDGATGTFPPPAYDENLAVSVVVNNPDGTTSNCNNDLDLGVKYERLVCNTPIGDVNPVVGESVNYTRSVANTYGRPWAAISPLVWEFEVYNTMTLLWEPLPSGTVNPFSHTFMVADEQYRLRYSAAVDGAMGLVGDNCQSPWLNITTYGAGLNYECEGNLTGNFSPAVPGSYVYSLDMDNGNGIDLQYRWVLTDYTGTDYVLATTTSTVDGVVNSPAFTLDQLAPVFADNYTLRVEVEAVDTLVSTHTCGRSASLVVGTITVDYSYNAGGWSNTAVPIQQMICLTNISDVIPGGIDKLNYTWDVTGNAANNGWGVNSRAEQQPADCISFSVPGTYTITLRAVTQSGLRNGSRAFVFSVYGLQSILINRTGSSFAGTTQNFTATGTNISGGYNWNFIRLSDGQNIGTATGANPSLFFNNPGAYRAEVRGNGPLGQTTAALEFTLLPTGGLTASFIASQYGGIAPMTVCFTDDSVSGSPIILWEWDFNGDGTYDLVYDPASIPAQICYTYNTPSMVYSVRLRVTNATFTDMASNTVRTYNLLESSATFTIAPQGGGAFCFTAQITPDVTVTGWEFGDGGTGPGQNMICYTYGASGAYAVSMHIDNGITTGIIIRIVIVDIGSGTPPILGVTGGCSADVTATFTVTNTGGAMTTPDQVVIRAASGNVVLIAPLQLAAGGSATFTVTGYEGNVSLSTTDLVVTTSTNCVEPPKLNSTSTCRIDGAAIFTITNVSQETAASQPYEVRDGANTVVRSGTLNVAINGSTDVIVAGIWGPLTFSTSGSQGPTTVVTDTSDCDTPPLLSGSSACLIDGSAVFTITNASPDTPASQPYTIRDASNTVVQSGTLNVPVNGSASVTISGIWGPLTFTSVGPQGSTTDLTVTSDCDEPPLLSVVASCMADGTIMFEITNASLDTAADQPYEIRDRSGNLVSSGQLQIPAGYGQQQITLPNSYNYVRLTSLGIQGVTTDITSFADCNEPPILSATSICAVDGTTTFTITNRSTESPANQSYEVRDAQGDLVQSGTLMVSINSSRDIVVSDVYGPLTLTSNGSQGATTNISVTSNCVQPPILTGIAVCEASVAVFTIVNSSTMSDASQPYTIYNQDNSPVQSGTLKVDADDSQEIVVTGVGGKLTFVTSGIQGETTALTVDTSCDALSETETPRDDDKDGDDTRDDDDTRGTRVPRHLPPMTMTPGDADTTLVERPAWEGLAMGEGVCPDWLVYHTNMTGDWEVFRLGDGGDGRLAQYDPNLSQGKGEDVVDMTPTRSPDGEWVAFTSNRDSDFINDVENWELYVTHVDNSIIRRMTYNTTAKDIDPAWSPDGRYIAFETDRDGNWELYLFDISTGAEIRLTDAPTSEINAFWTPDSQQLVFQSDRDGLWQLYSIDIATGETVKLSDGMTEDHDPAVSFDGERIAYRTENAGFLSAIWVMNLDGGGKHMISNPAGSASNHTWSPDDSVIAYQSDLEGDLDIYAFEVETEKTRLVTDNDIMDYAPTWLCDAPIIVFTSDVVGNPDIFNTPALPIEADAILVDLEANQMTFALEDDVYPENAPSEENASREGNVPPKIGTEFADNR